MGARSSITEEDLSSLGCKSRDFSWLLETDGGVRDNLSVGKPREVPRGVSQFGPRVAGLEVWESGGDLAGPADRLGASDTLHFALSAFGETAVSPRVYWFHFSRLVSRSRLAVVIEPAVSRMNTPDIWLRTSKTATGRASSPVLTFR